MKKQNNLGFAHPYVIIAAVVVTVAILGTGYRLNQSAAKKLDSDAKTSSVASSTVSKPKEKPKTITPQKPAPTDNTGMGLQHVDQTPYAPYYDALKRASITLSWEFGGTPTITQSRTPGYTLSSVGIVGPGSAYFYSTDGGKTWVYVGNTSDEWECSEFNTVGARTAYKGEQCWDSKNNIQSTVQ